MPKIAVFIEQRGGEVKKVAWQMLGEARRLADAHGGEAVAVLLGAPGGNGDIARLAGAHGAQKLLVARHDLFKSYNSEAWATALVKFCQAQKPDLLLVGSTSLGKDLGPKVAQRLGCACISDSIRITYEGGFTIRRPIFAGKCYVDVAPKTATAIIGIRPNAFALSEFAGAAAEETFDPGVDGIDTKAQVVELQAAAGRKVELTEAEIIVSGGRGIKGPENYHFIEELAATLGAAAGASRAIVDAGWIGHDHQVGQTGKTVSPNVYIACGISGAIQHLAGMSSSKCIVAINKDPNAPIFKVADYGVVGDLFQVLPAFQAEVAKIRG
jgi:electron transfer flavoprotein alpha subunit